MATYYIDFEGGNDANAGTSFATRWKTITNGATAARIAPGDEIRIMASPDPTSIGNATWTGGGRPTSFSISSSSASTPIVVTAPADHGLVPGDYVLFDGGSASARGVWLVGNVPTSTTFELLQIDGTDTTSAELSGGGFITKVNNCIVKTATPLVKNIALCGGLQQKPNWVASTNVTCGVFTGNYKEGYTCSQIAINAAFTTGKAAYYTLPATLDLSGYQQVSFWVRLASGAIGASGQTYLALCTDTLGATVVHQCPVPGIGATGAWVPVTVDFGTNLNSAIRSVAFYVATDAGAQTFYLDNIIACKASSAADSITLQSLISKSDGTGDEAWYAIQSINNDAIMLSTSSINNPNSNAIKGYSGTSETVTTYKRETVKTVPTSGTIRVSEVNDSGTDGNPITFSGGWNRTDMSTQTGRTWLDGRNGLGIGLLISGKSYIAVDKIDYCRYSFGFQASSATPGVTVNTVHASGCANTGVALNSTFALCGDIWACGNAVGVGVTGYSAIVSNIKDASGCSNAGLSFNGARNSTFGTVKANNCGGNTSQGGLSTTGSVDCTIGTLTIENNIISNGIIGLGATNLRINGGSASGNRVCVNLSSTIYATEIYLNNFTIGDTAEVSSFVGAGYLYSNRHDDTDGNNWIWQGDAGTINQQTSVVDGPATTSWLMRPTSSSAAQYTPLQLKLGTVVCAAGSLVTVTARMRRDDTGLTMRLCCPGGQISGVSSDVTSDMTAAADTWETVTITFTPTKPGGVDIYAYAWGGTTFSGYVCNLTASQA